MPKILGRIKSKQAMRKAGKSIYQKEYQKTKAEELRKARARGREQIRTKARQDAKKHNVTAQEKKKLRTKKMQGIRERMLEISKNMEKGLEQSQPTKKSGKKTTKKKDMWDLTLNDLI